ncbi:hypothetical protein [Pseudomonas fragi]|uniref:hypothetical protein n=1 Tax=Pseudomonas fragi TaxID=296 RepID=UPI001F491997|nr:hypothetical protein [Pseudomonas fragi]MCF6763384.1 hypothetical protein [Pseudomonas fragi]MCK6254714.1 hypothetical protein [Pseudomonas fragi]
MIEKDNDDTQNPYHKLNPEQIKETHHINGRKKLHTLPTPQTYCFYKALKAQITKRLTPTATKPHIQELN